MKISRPELHGKIPELTGLTWILCHMQVLDIERNLACKLVRRKEALKQNKGTRPVMSGIYPNNSIQILINLTLKIIYDYNRLCIVPHQLYKLGRSGHLLDPLGHKSASAQLLILGLPGGVAENHIPDSHPVLYKDILGREYLTDSNSLARGRGSDNKVRCAMLPGQVKGLAIRIKTHDCRQW